MYFVNSNLWKSTLITKMKLPFESYNLINMYFNIQVYQTKSSSGSYIYQHILKCTGFYLSEEFSFYWMHAWVHIMQKVNSDDAYFHSYFLSTYQNKVFFLFETFIFWGFPVYGLTKFLKVFLAYYLCCLMPY